jgi:hypothetical protein
MNNKEFAIFLENLVWKRMTIKQIENKIDEFLGVTDKIKLEKSFHWNDPEIADYLLVGSTEQAYNENENLPFCDFDIYVLPTKDRIEKKVVYYITEVGYEFE